jgi:single-stranded DNA-binding protein
MSGIECAFFGALGRDADRPTSKAGRAYLRLNVRVGDGEGAQWISVMVFDNDAIEVADKFTKGARVYVEGRLSISEWTAADGSKRSGLSVMSVHCRLSQIGRSKSRKPKGDGAAEQAASADDELDDQIPF